MTVLVNNDAIIEVTVAVRISQIPQVHLHTRIEAVRWRSEIRIVDATAVLRLGKNRIISRTTPAVIVLLEVTAGLVETVLIKNIMY